ncbi:hypothetical protein L3Y34_019493 [Caenorhabditis briggsae]|uniref:C-type LECtin n=1 Tax=Caenorhabditis briggsae TaxID=6238 RepID=A0AAE9IW58_CAEBR|nr:hypothetical protein L3Y34_019493 [Caenorhabditis briggsae]
MLKELIFLTLLQYSRSLLSDPICTNGYTLVNNKCLKLFIDKVTYQNAERNCMDVGATLVTVKNAIDNHAISTVAGSSANTIWMGLFCLDNDPSKCLWDDSTVSAELYSNFAPGFPHVDVGKCVYYSSQGALTGKWISGDCDMDKLAYICELPYTHADDCQYNYNGHCYSFYDALLPFTQAQEKCEKECGNLASIHSPNENRYLATLSNRLISGYNIYIGGMWPLPNVFNWIDGSQWSYNNIDPSYSHGPNCMTISNSKSSSVASGFWFSMNCYQANAFICKTPTGTKCPANQPVVQVTPVPYNPSFCNNSILLAPGVISSPDFPLPYSGFQSCTYQLSTLGSFNILLRFSDFQLESGKDFVKVYDGSSENSKLLGSFTGQEDAFALVSSGNTMLVTFKTGSTKGSAGFSARYTPYSFSR